MSTSRTVLSASLFLVFALLALASLAGWTGDSQSVDFAAGAAAEKVRNQPILVELFTSQGCSSCPPADRLLSRLADEAADEVIALSFHVDYWNYIGWQDPFSSKQWSERQEGYARALRTGRLYTPMLVVDGRDDVVGSQAAQVKRLLDKARARDPHGAVSLGGSLDGGKVLGEVYASLDPARAIAAAVLYVAVVETGLETSVTRGENDGRTLSNDYVVRRLDRVGTLTADAAAQESVEIPLMPEWTRENLGLVAFLQDPETFAIHGAALWRADS